MAWHTGRTDLPLSPAGEAEARAPSAGTRAASRSTGVLSSLLTRATTTAHLAGFGDRAEHSDALLEVDYGDQPDHPGDPGVAARLGPVPGRLPGR